MANVAVVLFVVLLAWYISSVIRRKSHGLVPKRGTGVASDLGTLADKPRVRVNEATRTGPDRVHVVLTPASDPSDGGGTEPSSDLQLVVSLREEESGNELLEEWRRTGKALAIVFPPDSRLVRLRSIDDLQPLTLRRVEDAT